MLKIKVRYFLSKEGNEFFPRWYQHVYEITLQQNGFKEMSFDSSSKQPIVELYFESQEKLDVWCATKQHNTLASAIETYFIKPPEVEMEVVDIN